MLLQKIYILLLLFIFLFHNVIVFLYFWSVIDN